MAQDPRVLVLPGWLDSDPAHWQSRWEAKLSTARRVEQAEWAKPVREDWVKRIVEEGYTLARTVLAAQSTAQRICTAAGCRR